MRALASANKDTCLRVCRVCWHGRARNVLLILILPRYGNETLFLFEIAPCCFKFVLGNPSYSSTVKPSLFIFGYAVCFSTFEEYYFKVSIKFDRDNLILKFVAILKIIIIIVRTITIIWLKTSTFLNWQLSFIALHPICTLNIKKSHSNTL